MGDHVFLKVSPTREVKRFGIRGMLCPRFIWPFEIFEHIGPVTYQLSLPPNLSGVHNVFQISTLRNYLFDPSHVVDCLVRAMWWFELWRASRVNFGLWGEKAAESRNTLREGAMEQPWGARRYVGAGERAAEVLPLSFLDGNFKYLTSNFADETPF